MQKLTRKLSLVMVALMTVFTALSYMPAKAATVVPKVQFVDEQKAEFTAGERITFNLNAANYGGRVQYRVVLWNDATKSYSDLWNTADKYYTNWMPYGNETLPLGWVINEPGSYRITIYAKRANLANSKTALKGSNCDSFLNGKAFTVKPAAVTPESIAPVADVTVNEGETPVLPAEVTINLADKTTKTAKVTWATVDTTKVGTVAVEGTVEGTDKKATVNVIVKAVELSAEVSATNLKEIVVKFTKPVDKVTAENKDAYVLIRGIGTVSIDSAVLQADGKTVVLTTTAALVNQATDYKLSIEKVKSAVGDLVLSQKNIAFRPLDSSFPTVEKVESLGNKAIKVTFSEPVKSSSTVASTFKIDGVVASGISDITGRTISITLFNKLSDGEHKLTINNNISDYANYQLIETTVPFTTLSDATAPVIAEVKDVTLEGATVVFSEDVKKAEAETASNYYWKQGSSVKEANSAKLLDGKTVRITFAPAKRLPGFTTDIFVKNVVDYSGNKIAADSKIAVTATLDQTRPEVLTYKFDNDTKTMVLTFSKPIAPLSFKATNVVIKDKDGKVVSNGYTPSLTDDGKTLTIIFTRKLAVGSYSFDFSGMKDTTLLENAMMPFSATLETVNTTKPNAVSLTGSGTIYVLTFDKAMDLSTSYSILNPANYFVTYTTTDTPARTISGLLPEATNLAPTSGNKGVIIQLPNGVASITKLTIQGVKDANGNFLEGYAKEFTTVSSTVNITKAVATAKDTIVLTMSQSMNIVDKTNFAIDEIGVGSTKAVTISKAEIDSTNDTKVVLTLGTLLSADAKNTNVLEVYTKGTPTLTQGLTGVSLVAIADGSGITVADEIALTAMTGDPAMVSVDTANTNTGLVVVGTVGDHDIQVIFDETVVVDNTTKLFENFQVYRADGVQLEYGKDFTASVAANIVTLEFVDTTANLIAYVGELQVVFDNSNENIMDAAENVAEGFDTATDVSDAHKLLIKFVAPLVTTGVSIDSTNKIVTITFNKALDATTVIPANFTGTAGTPTVVAGTDTATLTYGTALTSGQTVMVGAGVKDVAGNVITAITFTEGTDFDLN